MTPAQVLRRSARRLSAHCLRYGAGFYPSTGGRAFGARVRQGALQVTYDFRTWRPLDPLVAFTDHEGQPVFTA